VTVASHPSFLTTTMPSPRKGRHQPMAKTASDIAPPESLAAPTTVAILKNASQSARPPVAKSTSTGPLPQNRRTKK
jgi:hypothetical protein